MLAVCVYVPTIGLPDELLVKVFTLAVEVTSSIPLILPKDTVPGFNPDAYVELEDPMAVPVIASLLIV